MYRLAGVFLSRTFSHILWVVNVNNIDIIIIVNNIDIIKLILSLFKEDTFNATKLQISLMSFSYLCLINLGSSFYFFSTTNVSMCFKEGGNHCQQPSAYVQPHHNIPKHAGQLPYKR